LAIILFVAAAPFLCTSVSVLSLTDGHTHLDLRLDDGETYIYSYLNSIYNAPVEEHHIRTNNGNLSIVSVRSTSYQAVEYFRWDSDIRRVADAWEQTAPPNQVRSLSIRVSPQYRHRLTSVRWTVDLGEKFGDGIVDVSPERLPVYLLLSRGERP
jgi:hypothetical protein